MNEELFRLDGVLERDPRIERWFKEHRGESREIARRWFAVMRGCGDEVREVLHDEAPTACLGDAAFGYVDVFTAHVNVAFFYGAMLSDPAKLLLGNGKRMRHVKLKAGERCDEVALRALIENAYADIKERVENR